MKVVAAQQQEKTGGLRGRLILVGAFLYLLFLLVQMPLSWLLARLPDTLPVQFGRASGTLWQGAVNDLVWRVNADHIRLGNLSWRWLPAELLQGRSSPVTLIGRPRSRSAWLVPVKGQSPPFPR